MFVVAAAGSAAMNRRNATSARGRRTWSPNQRWSGIPVICFLYANLRATWRV